MGLTPWLALNLMLPSSLTRLPPLLTTMFWRAVMLITALLVTVTGEFTMIVCALTSRSPSPSANAALRLTVSTPSTVSMIMPSRMLASGTSTVLAFTCTTPTPLPINVFPGSLTRRLALLMLRVSVSLSALPVMVSRPLPSSATLMSAA